MFSSYGPDEIFPSMREQSVPLGFLPLEFVHETILTVSQVHDLLLEKFLAHFLSSVVLLLQVTYE